jgi:cyclomaltodextrinase
MILEAVKHIPKSQMAYAFDENNLHIYLQTAKNDIDAVELAIGDPFDWKIENGVYVWSGKSFPHKPMQKAYSTEIFDYFFLETIAVNKRSKYGFILHSGSEIWFYGTQGCKPIDSVDSPVVYNLSEAFNYPYINKEDLIDSPSWSKDAVWYQIFTDRFNKNKSKEGEYLAFGSIEEGIKNHMFFGGDLLGIIEKIPYLKFLGISGIYFTPIFKAYSAHKYDTEDYFQIDPSFGTNADFGQLVQQCHAAGIKVMLDAVFNHCGWDHAFFQDVIQKKKQSPYWDCFYIEDENFIDFPLDEKGRPAKYANFHPKYRTFGLTPFMPKLNTSNPIMEKYLLDVAAYWVKEYDIDGWRLDVSNEVSHAFWRKFRNTVRAIKPDVYILGENWDDSNPWLRGDQFDAVMNYEISYPIWQFFGLEKNPYPLDAEHFRFRISNLLVSYPKNVSVNMFNLVDSHDTMRILTRCRNIPELAKLCYLFIFSFCGSPAILYGDEIGLQGKDDPDSRRCMIWNPAHQNHDLFAFFQRMSALRIAYPETKTVDIVWHRAENKILIYEKQGLFFLLNNNPDAKSIALPAALAGSKVKDVETGKSETLGDMLSMKTYGYRIFKK